MKYFLIALTLTLLATPVIGQQVYKCPDADGVVKFQQLPCSGGESITVKPIPNGAGSGLSNNAKAYMQQRDQYWSDRAKADWEEAKRQEALTIERNKARAAEEQAEAQRATARAILITGHH